MESLMEEDLGASLPMNQDRVPVVGSPLAVRRYASAAMPSGVSRSDGTSVGRWNCICPASGYLRYEMSNLYGFWSCRTKLRVSYCNYSLIGKQGDPRAIGKCHAPSMWAFQSCRFQGIGAFRHSEFLRCCGNQDSENCGDEAAAALIWPSVLWSKRRASEIGGSCVGTDAVQTGRIRRLKRTVSFTFRRPERGLEGGLEGGLQGGLQALLKGAWRGLEGGASPLWSLQWLEGGFKGAWEGLQGGFKGASRRLEKGFKGASRGLEKGLKGAWRWRLRRGLEGGLRRASRGLEKGFKGASRGLEKGFKGASRGLEKGFNGASRWRGLQGGLKGASGASEGLWRGLQGEEGFKAAWWGLQKGFRGLQGGFRKVWRGFEQGSKGAWERLEAAWEVFEKVAPPDHLRLKPITCASNTHLRPPAYSLAPPSLPSTMSWSKF